MPTTKTYFTAAVVIPPQEVWEPIQAIRRIHDRHVRDWMPHFTLAYPFLPRAQFDEAAQRLSDMHVAPFDVALSTFRFFQHRPWSFTVWLDPEPPDPLASLQAEILTRFPECNDVASHADGFRPHLSVGQARSADLATRLQATWEPLRFRVSEIALLWRDEHQPFEVDRAVRLPG